MSKSPLLSRASEVVLKIADHLAEPSAVRDAGFKRGWYPQSLAHGAVGIALFHLAIADLVPGGVERAHSWLAEAASEPVGVTGNTGLFHGGPALWFVLGCRTDGQAYSTAIARMVSHTEHVVTQRLDAADARFASGSSPDLAEFDMIRGLAGLSVNFLEHRKNSPLLLRMLQYFVQLTEPVTAEDLPLPGWWSSVGPDGRVSADFPGGHCNMGLAHGLAGPLAVLASASRAGVEVEGQRDAILRICDWYDRWRQQGPNGPWWPNWITLAEFRNRRPVQDHAARPSWCYGAPGVIRALHLAAIATGDHRRKTEMEQAFLGVLDDGAQLGKLVDLTICHGWAGLLQIAMQVATDAEDPELQRRVPLLVDRVLQQAAALRRLTDPRHGDIGLLEGAAGVGLALHDAVQQRTSRWDAGLAIT